MFLFSFFSSLTWVYHIKTIFQKICPNSIGSKLDPIKIPFTSHYIIVISHPIKFPLNETHHEYPFKYPIVVNPFNYPIVDPSIPYLDPIFHIKIHQHQDTDVRAQAILIFAATGMICVGVVALQHVATVGAAGLNEDETVHEVGAQILTRGRLGPVGMFFCYYIMCSEGGLGG